MNKVIMGSVAIAVALALVFPLPAFAQKSPKEIKLKFAVEGNALVLKTGLFHNTTPSNCTKEDHPGCYDIPTSEYGSFKLTLKGGDADCDDADAWKWHSVTLGGEGGVDSPEPKPTAWGNISNDVANDFGADETTGVVNTTPDGKKRIEFTDKNESEYSIWYKVAVEHCGDSTNILEYDPRIDNRG